MPQGDSWGCYFMKDAAANYLWKETKGTGSLALPFETVLEKAKNASYWIGPGQFTSLKEMANANIHYTQFSAFKTKKYIRLALKRKNRRNYILRTSS